ncbi:hypothetical protein ACFOYW_13230 [Gryllotalpicola reticulitermitis]|uniref:DUF4231 domain-containing protein n=1 Tax=Gryllotalpicola reticulitermitis TaxID=1184153 RepID=A0ABV8Q7N1_9MICO
MNADSNTGRGFEGRGRASRWGGRLPETALAHYRRYARILVLGFSIVGAILVCGFVVLILVRDAWIGNSIFGLGVAVAVVVGVISQVEYSKVKALAGASYALTRAQSRKLDIWTPAQFDASLSALRAQQSPAAQPEAEAPKLALYRALRMRRSWLAWRSAGIVALLLAVFGVLALLVVGSPLAWLPILPGFGCLVWFMLIGGQRLRLANSLAAEALGVPADRAAGIDLRNMDAFNAYYQRQRSADGSPDK